MTAGLLQLTAIGPQDIYLTGNPQISFFESVYRRYSNYVIENHKLIFTGKIDFSRTIICNIQNIGDLLHKLILEIDFKLKYQCNENGVDIKDKVEASENPLNTCLYAERTHLSNALIKSLKLKINDNVIDEHYGMWLQIQNELDNDNYTKINNFFTGNNKSGLTYNVAKLMSGDTDITIKVDDNAKIDDIFEEVYKFYIPLKFWFCKESSSALPLISLPNHNIEIEIDIEREENIKTNSDFGKIGSDAYITILSKEIDMNLNANYIILDKPERQRFVTKPHEYLIEQLQINRLNKLKSNSDINRELYFNFPIKELIWVSTCDDFSTSSCDFVSLSNSKPQDCVVKLLLNGYNRFTPRNMSYFTKLQPYIYHNNIPNQNTIGVYSFCLYPKNLKPSGTCNFSILDNAILEFNFKKQENSRNKLNVKHLDISGNIILPYSQEGVYVGKVIVFAVNYNMLKIKDGNAYLIYK